MITLDHLILVNNQLKIGIKPLMSLKDKKINIENEVDKRI
jgi:hypothetical protein